MSKKNRAIKGEGGTEVRGLPSVVWHACSAWTSNAVLEKQDQDSSQESIGSGDPQNPFTYKNHDMFAAFSVVEFATVTVDVAALFSTDRVHTFLNDMSVDIYSLGLHQEHRMKTIRGAVVAGWVADTNKFQRVE